MQQIYRPDGSQIPVNNGFEQSPEFAGGINGALSGRNFGGVTRGDLYGYKTDPSTAVGTPYAQFLTGGQGSGGPINFGLGRAMQYARSGGMVGPGFARAARDNRMTSGNWGAGGAMFGPAANGGGAQPNGMMYANGGGAAPGAMASPTYPGAGGAGFGQMPLNPNASAAPGGVGSYGPLLGGSGMPPGMKPPTGVYSMDSGGGQPSGLPGTYGGQYSPIGGGGSPGVNPYLGGQINSLARLFTNQLQRNTIPGIDSNAIMAGQYGSARNGIAAGLATGDSMRAFGDAATGLLGQDWTNQQNRNLTNQGQMLNYASDQRSQDRQDLLAGSSLYNIGTNSQWDPIRNANGVYGSYTGFGNNTSSQGGGAMGGLGGAMAGSLIYKNLFGTPGGPGTLG